MIINGDAEFLTVLADTSIPPGTTIKLADGTYTGEFTSLFAGTEAEPIIVMPINPGEVILDGSLNVQGIHTHWYDFNFTDSNPDRYEYDYYAIYTNKVGTRFHGCLVTDLHGGAIYMFGVGEGEISECVIYNNGYMDTLGEGHGHAIYTHNHPGGGITIARNILGYQLGRYALHIYSGGANWLKDYNVYDNVTCNRPTHTGGGLGLVNFDYHDNIQYGRYSQHGRYSAAGGNDNGHIYDNYFIDQVSYYVDADWSNLEENGNEVYGGEPSGRSGYTEYSQPATKIWLKAFSKSSRWVGMVTIFNRDSANHVDVDFSSILSPNRWYLIRNGQNMAETWKFKFSKDATVPVPMDIWHAPQIIGMGEGLSVLPVFGAFVIEETEVDHQTYMPVVMNKRQMRRWNYQRRLRGRYP